MKWNWEKRLKAIAREQEQDRDLLSGVRKMELLSSILREQMPTE